jgi:hypothetical protein
MQDGLSMVEQARSPSRSRRLTRQFLALIAILLVPLIFCAAYQLWQNNRSVAAPSPQSVSASLEKSIGWLVNNREAILGQNNPMLWWFVKKSADITRDERLHTLFLEYKRRHIDPYPKNVWRNLLEENSKVPVDMWQFEHFPDYNLYFLYGASCSRNFEKEEIIRRQHETSFCDTYHPFSPACVTHQLMGVRLVQQNRCLDSQTTHELVRALQEKIVNQLVWDPRVMDVYIQRVLMIAESGAGQRIKPVWMQRVLEAQLPDGSWSGFYPVMPLGGGYHLGFPTNKITVSQVRGGFHATAQGVLLMSLVASGDAGI